MVCAGWMHSKQTSICNDFWSMFYWTRKQTAGKEGSILLETWSKRPLLCLMRTRSTQNHHILRYLGLDTLTDWISVLTPSFLNPVSEAGVEVINLHPALPGVSKQLWVILAQLVTTCCSNSTALMPSRGHNKLGSMAKSTERAS